MGPHDIDRITADAERIVTIEHPGFDITTDEKKIMCSHAEKMCLIVSSCSGDKLAFLEPMMSMTAMAEEGPMIARGQLEHILRSESRSEEEIDEAIRDFDERYGGQIRIQRMQQAVNMACCLLVEEERTIIGKVLEARRRLLHWWNDKEGFLEPRSVRIRISEQETLDDAIMRALACGHFTSAMCSDVSLREYVLEIDDNVDTDDAVRDLRELGFEVIED